MIFNFLNYGILIIFMKLFFKKFFEFLRNVRFADSIIYFYYKTVK